MALKNNFLKNIQTINSVLNVSLYLLILIDSISPKDGSTGRGTNDVIATASLAQRRKA
jgi:hypothetical protein